MITTATKQDTDTLVSFYQEVIASLEKRTNYPLWTWGIHPDLSMLESAIAQNEMLLFTSDADFPIPTEYPFPFLGAAIVNTSHDGGDRPIWNETNPEIIHLFAIHPNLSGHQLADRFLEEIIERIQARGKDSVRLDLIDGNWPARNLYSRHGFESRGVYDYQPEKEAVLTFEYMELPLSQD